MEIEENEKESEGPILTFKNKPKGRPNIRKRTKDEQEEEESTSIDKIRSMLQGKQEPPSLKKSKTKRRIKEENS